MSEPLLDEATLRHWEELPYDFQCCEECEPIPNVGEKVRILIREIRRLRARLAEEKP